MISIPILLQIGFLVSLLALARQANRYQQWEVESSGSTASIDRLLAFMVDAEAGVHGYVDTGNADVLTQYHMALHAMPAEFDLLRRMRLLEAEERRDSKVPDRFDVFGLERASSPVLAFLREQERLVTTGQQQLALERDRAGSGKRLFDAFRAQVAGNLDEDRQVDQERRIAVQQAQNRLRDFLIGGIALSGGLILPLTAVFLRSVIRRLRVVSDNSERLARGDPLNEPDGGSDEVAVLDRRFHEMADQLRRAEGQLRQERDELDLLHGQVSEQNASLEALSEERNRFLGFAAHDLRNPLMSAKTYSLLLERSGLQHTQQELVARLSQALSTMSRLISDFLDVSTFTAGRPSLRKSLVNLSDLIAQVVEQQRPRAQKKGLKLQTSDYGPVMARVDADKIIQVLDNLVTNAVKFSVPPGSVAIEVAVDLTDVLVSVIDHGQGIPPEEIGLLFQPFSKTSVRPTAGEPSTGLGLAICKKVIEAHGGRISVESTVGKGSTFHISIPLDAS